MTSIITYDWKPSLHGYVATLEQFDYILEVWEVDFTPGWFAGVNNQIVQDSFGEIIKDKTFGSYQTAQAAAIELAEEMLRKDGLIK